MPSATTKAEDVYKELFAKKQVRNEYRQGGMTLIALLNLRWLSCLVTSRKQKSSTDVNLHTGTIRGGPEVRATVWPYASGDQANMRDHATLDFPELGAHQVW